MSSSILSFESVRNAGLALPGVVEGVHYGASALKLRGHMLACTPVNKSAEINSAVISIDLKRRAALLAARPTVYYITDHYAPHPVVLMRLSSLSREELRQTLALAWEYVSSLNAAGHGKAATKSSARKSRTAAGRLASSRTAAPRARPKRQ